MEIIVGKIVDIFFPYPDIDYQSVVKFVYTWMYYNLGVFLVVLFTYLLFVYRLYKVKTYNGMFSVHKPIYFLYYAPFIAQFIFAIIPGINLVRAYLSLVGWWLLASIYALGLVAFIITFLLVLLFKFILGLKPIYSPIMSG